VVDVIEAVLDTYQAAANAARPARNKPPDRAITRKPQRLTMRLLTPQAHSDDATTAGAVLQLDQRRRAARPGRWMA
jgi:hypothetical protein